MKLHLAYIPVEKVRGTRFREEYGDITALSETIRDKGVIQPITVRHDGDDWYYLKAGGRRLAAAKEAGYTQIPAIIRIVDADDDAEIDDREVELIENIFRKDMTWNEQALLTKEIQDVYIKKHRDWSQAKLARLLNKGTADVSRNMQLAAALEVMPELAKVAKTQDEAFKMLKKLEEGAIVQELRQRQQVAMAKGHRDMLQIADCNYIIGDTFEGLAELRTDGLIHCIECDPPYAVDLNELKDNNEQHTETYNEVKREAYPDFLHKLCGELYRVAAKHSWLIFWFGPTHFTLVKASLLEAGWAVDDIPAIWHRVGSSGQTRQPNINLGRAYEPFFVCRKGQPTLAKAGRSNVFAYEPVPSQKKFHATQRPLPLIQEILETFTFTGQNVLIPFLGSGTTLRAVYNLGLTGWGFDNDKQYKDRFMIDVEADTRALDEEADVDA